MTQEHQRCIGKHSAAAAATEVAATAHRMLSSAAMLGLDHPALGANASSEVRHRFCRLPLVTFSPWTRGYSPRSPDADSVRSRRKGRVDLRQSFHENNQGTERYKNCIAFSMFSDAFHQLKCRSRRQQRQREKRTLYGPGHPAICRCEQLCSFSSPRLGSGILTGFPVPQRRDPPPKHRDAGAVTTGLSKEVFLGGQDRLTPVQVLFTGKPTPHRSSAFSGRIIATTTKICTRKPIHAGSRHALRLGPCALLHCSGFNYQKAGVP